MNDLISRQAAIDAVANYLWHYPNEQYKNLNVLEVGESLVKDALSIVPSADRPTMDKEYLIDLIQEAVYDGEACAKLIDLVDRPTGWIPVSERLPDIGDTFLVTVMVGKEIRTDVADSFGSYIDGFWDTFNDWIEDEECHVIAWMPLPPGYQGE